MHCSEQERALIFSAAGHPSSAVGASPSHEKSLPPSRAQRKSQFSTHAHAHVWVSVNGTVWVSVNGQQQCSCTVDGKHKKFSKT